MNVARGTAPRHGSVRARVWRQAPGVAALLLVVLVSAACTSVASAHEADHEGHGQDQHGQDHEGQDHEGHGQEGHGQEGHGQEGHDGQDQDRHDQDEEEGQNQDQDQDQGDGSGGVVVVNGLETLGRTCDNSRLERHHGFQEAPRCSVTEMGEIPAAEDGPQLLITGAPRSVEVGEPFTLRVSSRNLVRDRFLAAGEGGYYLESAFLNGEGLIRGHFHTACRILSDGVDAAPDPAVAVDFFEATEDGGGGAEPDEVQIDVPGFSEPGLAQCAAWAGDGSHRIPMMESAQQIPAFDTVLFSVG